MKPSKFLSSNILIELIMNSEILPVTLQFVKTACCYSERLYQMMINTYVYTRHFIIMHYYCITWLGSRLEIVCEGICEILFQQSLIYCITILLIIL